ncbi:MAG: chloride channel protein [Flavobacteriales bacterium]|jgi:H+/Cl- antiporter ClcA
MTKWVILLLAVVSGLATAFFLKTLDLVTSIREDHASLIWLLPLGGLVIVWLYRNFGEKSERGNLHIKETYRINDERGDVSITPLVYAGTLITHLFGGSAGREGTAVQMSFGIGEYLQRIFPQIVNDKKLIIQSALAAGFSAVFGTPVAGFLFSLEYLNDWKKNSLEFLYILAASFVAHFTVLLLGVGHTDYHYTMQDSWTMKLVLFILLFVVVAYVVGLGYRYISQRFTEMMKHFFTNEYLRVLAGGVLIVVVVFFLGSTRHIGLGVPVIEESFTLYQDGSDWIIKLLLTAFTLAAGFRGGDVTPLFFVGATLGSWFAGWINVPAAVFASIGFVVVFGSAYKTPLTTLVLFIELFLL